MYIPRFIRKKLGPQLSFAGAWRAPLLLATAVILSCDGSSENDMLGPNMAVGAATRLAFTVEPSSTTGKAPIFPGVKVTALDASGNTITAFRGRITVAIGTNPAGGLLFGSTSSSAVNGVATFSNLSIDKAGTGYTLKASSPKLATATSAAFNIALPATQLIFSVQPSTTSQGATISPAVHVTALDKNGKLAEGYRQNVTVAIGTNPPAGTLAGTKTVTAVHGVATFSDLSIDKIGSGYTLRATSLKLAATSAAFTIAANGTRTDLGTLGASPSAALGVNDAGQVVGYGFTSSDQGGMGAFIWQNGTITDLGSLLGGENQRMATAINASGQVAGISSLPGNATNHAFLWDDGTVTDLGDLGGEVSYAYGINDVGQVVGDSYIPGYLWRAFIWQGGVMTDLGALGSGESHATAINNSGWVVGRSTTFVGSGTEHAFIYKDGTMSDLGNLGGNGTYATAINDVGQVVGYGFTATGQLHAFLWQDGIMSDLGNLGGARSLAFGISDDGQVVGYINSVDGGMYPFRWQNGTTTDLGTLGGSTGVALGINDRGQIVGHSLLSGDSEDHATLWSGF
jgi:probable HAF family extracellular repeat protein